MTEEYEGQLRMMVIFNILTVMTVYMYILQIKLYTLNMYNLLYLNFLKVYVLLQKFFKTIILTEKPERTFWPGQQIEYAWRRESIDTDSQASGLYTQLNDGTISEIRRNRIEPLEVLGMGMKIMSLVYSMMLDLWWRGIQGARSSMTGTEGGFPETDGRE